MEYKCDKNINIFFINFLNNIILIIIIQITIGNIINIVLSYYTCYINLNN